MIVTVSRSGVAAARDLDDVKRFHVEAEFPKAALVDVVSAAVAFDGEAIAWVDIAWLRAQPGLAEDAARLAALDGMIAWARPRGWVDETRGAIRAHVEWPDGA